MLYHQQKTDFNAKGYQNMREDIRNAYAELEDIGWNQVVSDEDVGGGESANSEEAPRYMAALANAERRNMRERDPGRQKEEACREQASLCGQPPKTCQQQQGQDRQRRRIRQIR
eukprot:12805867-Heterocapsa_arctica.AAC.1